MARRAPSGPRVACHPCRCSRGICTPGSASTPRTDRSARSARRGVPPHTAGTSPLWAWLRPGRHRLLGGDEHLLQRPVEVADHRHPFLAALLDLVQALFEGGRVVVVGDDLEVVDHDRVHRFADAGRVEAAFLDLDVTVVFRDRLDDRCIRRGPADSALLQLLYQRRLRVPRRRLAEVLLGFDDVEGEVFAGGELRQVGLAVLVALPHLVEAVEREHRSRRPEDVVPALDLDLGLVVHGGRHATGGESPPDEVVQLELVCGQVLANRIRRAADVGRPDGLVGILRARAGLRGSRAAYVFLAEPIPDQGLHLRLGLRRDARRVRAHVGDEPGRSLVAELNALVQLLSDTHGVERPEAQAARCVLLEGGRYVRQIRALGAALLLHANDPVGRALQRSYDRIGLGLGLDLELGLWVGAACNVSRTVQASQETALVGKLGELDVNRPGLDRYELADLLLAVDHEAKGDRRNPSGPDSLLDLAPQERAQAEADQAGDHAACLLRVDQSHIDLAGGFQCLADGLRRDLLELDAL